VLLRLVASSSEVVQRAAPCVPAGRRGYSPPVRVCTAAKTAAGRARQPPAPCRGSPSSVAAADAAGGHEARRHGDRAACLPGRRGGAAVIPPGQDVQQVGEAGSRPRPGTHKVLHEACPQHAEQGAAASGRWMRAGAASRCRRALVRAPGARSPQGHAAGPPSRLCGRAGEFLREGGQLGGCCRTNGLAAALLSAPLGC